MYIIRRSNSVFKGFNAEKFLNRIRRVLKFVRTFSDALHKLITIKLSYLWPKIIFDSVPVTHSHYYKQSAACEHVFVMPDIYITFGAGCEETQATCCSWPVVIATLILHYLKSRSSVNI
jgi:hypothetical protein